MTEPKFGPAGELDAGLRKELDERLGCTDPDDEALLARVKARVMRSIQAESDAQHRTVRAEEGAWRIIGPGVERKLLWSNGSMESWMVRLAPGAIVRGHLHSHDEECVVLAGSLRIGPHLLLRQGDFHVAATGSMHESVTTETGALVYLRGAPTEDALG
jgi:quercetin dioxygenase-like cupin family protein